MTLVNALAASVADTAAATSSWGTIWEVVKTFADLGLVLFAGTQLVLQQLEMRDRRRSAFTALYAEYWRLQALLIEWRSIDLVSYAASGVLYVDLLAPKDWGALIRLLGEVSTGTAALGAQAYALLNRTITDARRLLDLVGNGGDVGSGGKALEGEIKDSFEQAVLCLSDAMKAAPSWLIKHKFNVVDPESRIGKKLERRLLEGTWRLVRSRRHEPRLGFVGRVLGRAFTAAGVWFDPTAQRYLADGKGEDN